MPELIGNAYFVEYFDSLFFTTSTMELKYTLVVNEM